MIQDNLASSDFPFRLAFFPSGNMLLCRTDVWIWLFKQELMAQNGITYVLNASNTCPKPDFISENHFLRIPVNDSYCEKLLPWLEKTNEFIGKNALPRILPNGLLMLHRGSSLTMSTQNSSSFLLTVMTKVKIMVDQFKQHFMGDLTDVST